jgi:hypothetical protein
MSMTSRSSTDGDRGHVHRARRGGRGGPQGVEQTSAEAKPTAARRDGDPLPAGDAVQIVDASLRDRL